MYAVVAEAPTVTITGLVHNLLDGLEASEVRTFTSIQDSDGWTAIHFVSGTSFMSPRPGRSQHRLPQWLPMLLDTQAAKTGILTHLPWVKYLGIANLATCGVALRTTALALTPLHIAAVSGLGVLCNRNGFHSKCSPTLALFLSGRGMWAPYGVWCIPRYPVQPRLRWTRWALYLGENPSGAMH